jgi:hypothetical protein
METLGKCFLKEDNCVAREIAGETIIVPIKSCVGDLDSIYTLNEVGTLIWHLIDGQRNVGQIVETVREAYDVKSEEVTRDTVDFLSSLEKAGLIRHEVADRSVGP